MIQYLQILEDNNLQIEQLFLLYLLKENRDEFLNYISKTVQDPYVILQNLHRNDYIFTNKTYLDFESIKITKKGNSTVDELNPKTLFKKEIDWIDEWRNLWAEVPNDIRERRIRQSKNNVLTKMNKFIKKTNYSKDVIFTATINYINKCQLNNYKSIQSNDYFIEKDGISNLESECEGVTSDDVTLKDAFLNKM